jgi:hypothetical protein
LIAEQDVPIVIREAQTAGYIQAAKVEAAL